MRWLLLKFVNLVEDVDVHLHDFIHYLVHWFTTFTCFIWFYLPSYLFFLLYFPYMPKHLPFEIFCLFLPRYWLSRRLRVILASWLRSYVFDVLETFENPCFKICFFHHHDILCNVGEMLWVDDDLVI